MMLMMMLQPFTTPIASAILIAALATGRSALAANPRPPPAQWMACPQVPSLHCANGSVCKQGVASFDSKHDHLGLQTHESGYYCECMDGFIGHECTIEVEDCENSIGYSPSDPTGVFMHSCYHGSTCKNFGNGNTMCDCDQLNQSSAPDATKFAGLMCEHESTSLCAVSLIGMSAPNHQFCTNHGRCKKEVMEGAPHPKCDCREGWSGDHCEIRSDVFAKGGFQSYQNQQKQQGVSAMTVGGKVMFSFIIIALAAVLIGIVVLVYSQIKRKRGPRAKAVGITAADVGAGEIEMDGSSTLNSPAAAAAQSSKEDDFDLSLDVEDAVAADDSGDQTFTISDSHDDEEDDDAEGSDTEPTIV
eukprot:CAMPEP_0201711046 /NCGR_PEP_ID=MMETSP0578-20130828/58943_1 /ASSEMBLY_ACC=CAM_ASM_000663 /TAXON_ID=267565 /ORGANISM="Skeletonema grethea, Strain CCMP 1804" /LENGTH=358 /DNA_ID=CAMNT_0048200095 /DNA_START=31 /DNA_END=1110 /DNA_ORIENTATION=+